MNSNLIWLFKKRNIDMINGILIGFLIIIAGLLFYDTQYYQIDTFGYGTEIYYNDRIDIGANNFTYIKIPTIFFSNKQITSFSINLRITRGSNQEVRLYTNLTTMDYNILQNTSYYKFISISMNLNQGGQKSYNLYTTDPFILTFANNSPFSSQCTIIITFQGLQLTSSQIFDIYLFTVLVIAFIVILLVETIYFGLYLIVIFLKVTTS